MYVSNQHVFQRYFSGMYEIFMDFDSEVFSKIKTGNGAAAIRQQIMEWYSADQNFGSLKIVKKLFERFNSNFATTYYQMSGILQS